MVYFLFGGQRMLCLRPLWGFVCVATPPARSQCRLSPPSPSLCCSRLQLSLYFRFGNWPVLFIYAYLKVMSRPRQLRGSSILKTVCLAGLQVMPGNFGARCGTELASNRTRLARSRLSTSLARFVTHYVRTLLKPGSTFATFHTHRHTNTF